MAKPDRITCNWHHYPGPPCAPSLIKSRKVPILPTHFLLSWNSLYVYTYTRGTLGCLLGSGPWAKPCGGKKRSFENGDTSARSNWWKKPISLYKYMNTESTSRRHNRSHDACSQNMWNLFLESQYSVYSKTLKHIFKTYLRSSGNHVVSSRRGDGGYSANFG